MKKLTKVLALIMVLALAICSMTACSSKKAASYTVDDLLQKDWTEIEKLAKEEGSLIFTSWYNEAGYTELLNAFSAKYGIKVELAVADADAFAQKALSEKASNVGTIDVALIGNQIKTLLDGQVLAGPILDKINDENIIAEDACKYQEGIETHGMVVPYYYNQTGILYNSAVVPFEEVPQTFEELEAWIDSHPGRFGYNIPEKGGSGQSFCHLVLTTLSGGLEPYYASTEENTALTDQWSKGWEWLNSRKDIMVITQGNNDSISRLNQGEIDMTIAWNDDLDVCRKDGEIGPEALLTVPKMGLAGGGDSMGVLKNAPHKAAALLFIEWCASLEGQQAMVDIIAGIPVRTDMDGLSGGLTLADMENRVAWFPIVYKTKMNRDFNVEVLG